MATGDDDAAIIKRVREDEMIAKLRGVIKEASKEAVLEILAEQASTRTGEGTATETDPATPPAKTTPPAKKTAPPAKTTGGGFMDQLAGFFRD